MKRSGFGLSHMVVAVGLMLGGCGEGVLDPQGPVAAANRTILFNSLGIMLAVVIPTVVGTLAVAWWFRSGNTRARYRPDWTFSGQIELVVWAVPAMVVLLLGGIAWVGSHELEPSRPLASRVRPVEVEVVSLDWKWLFIYPDQGIATVNRLIVPTGTPIEFRLTSASVMNSFFVPQLGSQIYTMAGMATRLNLQADRPGRYPGLSAQYSGEGFSDMHFDVLAVPPGAASPRSAAGDEAGARPMLDVGQLCGCWRGVAASRSRPITLRCDRAGAVRCDRANDARPHPNCRHLIGEARTERVMRDLLGKLDWNAIPLR